MLWTPIGLAIIAVAVRDIVHELFHPELTGSISRTVARAIWRICRALGRYHHSAINHAGPIILVAVGAAWLSLMAVGGALLYLPHLPREFDVSRTLPAGAERGFTTALYVSLAELTSVGSTDFTPTTTGMRLVAVIEPVLGLAVISAWITWVLSIYPIIAERRAFTREVDLLRRAQPDPAALIGEAPHEAIAELLRSFTSSIVRIGTDLNQTHISYYFQNEQPRLTLGAQLPFLLQVAHAAADLGREPLIRHYGGRLRMAIEEFLRELGADHLGLVNGSPETVLAALARDHLLPNAPR